MAQLITTNIGRLRITGFLEGISYLILLFVAMPLKYFYHQPELTRITGTAHGALFVLYIVFTIIVSFEHNWNLTKTTWKVILASFLPFGTFYVDNKILSKEPQDS